MNLQNKTNQELVDFLKLYEWSPHFQLIYTFQDYINAIEHVWLNLTDCDDYNFIKPRMDYLDNCNQPTFENMIVSVERGY